MYINQDTQKQGSWNYFGTLTSAGQFLRFRAFIPDYSGYALKVHEIAGDVDLVADSVEIITGNGAQIFLAFNLKQWQFLLFRQLGTTIIPSEGDQKMYVQPEEIIPSF